MGDLRHSPSRFSRWISEAGADEELVQLEQRHLEHHRSIRSDDRSSS